MKKRKRRFRSVPLKIKERVLRAVVEERRHDRGPLDKDGKLVRADRDEIDGNTVVTRVQRMHMEGRIDQSSRDACVKWYEDYAVGIERAREQAHGGGNPGDGEFRFLLAAEHWRAACEAMGKRRTAILTWFVLEDRAFEWIGGRLEAIEGKSCPWETARELCCFCAKDLAKWYAGEKVR